MYVCVPGGKKCSFFRKTSQALFSCYLSFETRLFALLPTISILPESMRKPNLGNKRVKPKLYQLQPYY